MGGRKARSEQFITDMDCTLLRGKVRFLKRWEGFFQTVLNKKPPELDLTITALFPPRPLPPSHGVDSTTDDMMEVIRSAPNSIAVGPNSLSAEVLKLGTP